MKPPQHCPEPHCPEPQALSGYLDGTLDGGLGDPDSLVRHLETCDRCLTELDAVSAISRLLAVGEDIVRPDPNFLPRFRRRLDQALGTSAETWRWLALRLAPLSVAALLGAILVVALEPAVTETFVEIERRVLATGSPSSAELASNGDWSGDWAAGPLGPPPSLRSSP